MYIFKEMSKTQTTDTRSSSEDATCKENIELIIISGKTFSDSS